MSTCLGSVANHQRVLQRYFSSRVREQQDVADLVQESFARFLASKAGEDLRSPQAYLLRIGSNLVADRARSRSPLRQARTLEEVGGLAVPPTQEHGLYLVDLESAFAQAMSELPPRCREVFIMRRLEGMATPEVGRTLGISARMVQKHMIRASNHLRGRLQQFTTSICFMNEEHPPETRSKLYWLHRSHRKSHGNSKD